MSTTTDLSKFGWKEFNKLRELLAHVMDVGLPEGMSVGVYPMLNTSSGYVFLTDEDYNVAMVNAESGKLEMFYSCPECGHEGFKEDMQHGEDNEECKEFLENII